MPILGFSIDGSGGKFLCQHNRSSTSYIHPYSLQPKALLLLQLLIQIDTSHANLCHLFEHPPPLHTFTILQLIQIPMDLLETRYLSKLRPLGTCSNAQHSYRQISITYISFQRTCKLPLLVQTPLLDSITSTTCSSPPTVSSYLSAPHILLCSSHPKFLALLSFSPHSSATAHPLSRWISAWCLIATAKAMFVNLPCKTPYCACREENVS
ncbi:hypothetical protein BKA63DRAFT_15999 [Paraphoma chrysanthemicola]|nr:hypothetical protein BKA63DRAFT_15999 [Paraphoma chrysanthemicola]